AGVHKLPVITMVENNKYAISVPIEKQLATEKVSDRAVAYGMPGYTVDGNDPLAVYEVVKAARERADNGEGPSLIETMTYRFTAHSSDDDDRKYIKHDGVDKAKKNDSIITISSYLFEAGVLTDAREKEIHDDIDWVLNEATEYAENAPYAKPEDTLRFVYDEA